MFRQQSMHLCSGAITQHRLHLRLRKTLLPVAVHSKGLQCGTRWALASGGQLLCQAVRNGQGDFHEAKDGTGTRRSHWRILLMP